MLLVSLSARQVLLDLQPQRHLSVCALSMSTDGCANSSVQGRMEDTKASFLWQDAKSHLVSGGLGGGVHARVSCLLGLGLHDIHNLSVIWAALDDCIVLGKRHTLAVYGGAL